jgi:hypothetical protein
MTAMKPPQRPVMSASTGLLLALGVAACSAQGADGGTSSFRANLPSQSTTQTERPARESRTFIPPRTTRAAPVPVTVPATSVREVSRVVVNLSDVPAKTSSLTRVPQSGRLYDLRAACVMRADGRDHAATFELTDSAPDSAPPCRSECRVTARSTS